MGREYIASEPFRVLFLTRSYGTVQLSTESSPRALNGVPNCPGAYLRMINYNGSSSQSLRTIPRDSFF